jgi:hypothetical protein
MASADVTSDNEDEIAKRLYPPKPPLRYKYDVGDRVRIAKYKHVFQKGYLLKLNGRDIRDLGKISDVSGSHMD